jgi:5-methylcytosine-specific restriction protein A
MPKPSPKAGSLTADVFRAALAGELDGASRAGQASLRMRAGDLHGVVGGYPGPNNRMPLCCEVMKKAMATGDKVVESPPSGQGASLTIEYGLPRR